MTEIFYNCICGCRNRLDQLIRINHITKTEKHQRSKIEVCAKHGINGKIISRESICLDCEIFFPSIRKSGRLAQRCPKCITEHTRQRNNNSAERYREKVKSKEKEEIEIEIQERVKNQIKQIPFCKEICGTFCVKVQTPFSIHCGKKHLKEDYDCTKK